jgi:hypothetical protein
MLKKGYFIAAIWTCSLAGSFWAGAEFRDNKIASDSEITIRDPHKSSRSIIDPKPQKLVAEESRISEEESTHVAPHTADQKAETLLGVANEDFLAIHIKQWLESDLSAAAEWLNSKPQDPRLDEAVAEFAIKASQHDPEVAFDWALSIVDERKRLNAISSVGRLFRNRDPQGFDDRISSLAPDEQDQIKSVTKPQQRYRGGGTFYPSPDGEGRVAFTANDSN